MSDDNVSTSKASTSKASAAGAAEPAVPGPGAPPAERVSRGRRLAAFGLDAVLSALAAGLFTRPEPPGAWSTVVYLVAVTVFLGVFGETPGMRVLGLRCQLAEEPPGRPIGIPRAALRAVLLLLLIPALMIDARGRYWHDRLAKATIVRA